MIINTGKVSFFFVKKNTDLLFKWLTEGADCAGK